MGRHVASAAAARGHHISRIVDPSADEATSRNVDRGALGGSDLVIEFAEADGALDRLELYAETGIPAVVGTTGVSGGIEALRAAATARGATYLWGSNFSVGANMLFRLSEIAASWLDSLPEYDIAVHEEHHRQKKDSPSGTALSIAEAIIKGGSRKKRPLSAYPDGPVSDDLLHVSSTRVGSAFGLHRVTIDSDGDVLRLEHSAKGRGAFASGAVMAGEWLQNRRGFFSAEDYFASIFSRVR